MKMKEVLYIPGLNKNILSISDLDKKGFRVAFVDGEVLMWPKGKTIDDAVVIGIETLQIKGTFRFNPNIKYHYPM